MVSCLLPRNRKTPQKVPTKGPIQIAAAFMYIYAYKDKQTYANGQARDRQTLIVVVPVCNTSCFTDLCSCFDITVRTKEAEVPKMGRDMDGQKNDQKHGLANVDLFTHVKQTIGTRQLVCLKSAGREQIDHLSGMIIQSL